MSGLALILSLTALVLVVQHRNDHVHLQEQKIETPSVALPPAPVPEYSTSNEDMYAPRFHASLNDRYDLNGTGVYPSAVFYGDLVIRGGTIKYDDRALVSTVTSASLPAVGGGGAGDVTVRAKDTCLDDGSCHCGIGFSAGIGHLLLVSCHDCTEIEFLDQRGTCCSRPSRCRANSNETCARFGAENQATACVEAGCLALNTTVVLGNSTPSRVTRCIARTNSNNWTAVLQKDEKTASAVRLRHKQAELVRLHGVDGSRLEMDRPSYHVPPDQILHVDHGGLVHFFDTATGNPYVYIPSEANPETMAFQHYLGATAKPANLTFYDDRTPLNAHDGTFMARVEVPTTWDLDRHYDLREIAATGLMELVYETPSKLPFFLYEQGKIRGTGRARLGSANVTIVGVTTASVANPTTKESEPDRCLAVAASHLACFDDMNTAYATCVARLHSASAPQCCGHLYDVGIFVGCSV